MSEPALGILELSSIARGVIVVDVMAKRSPVRILQNHPVSPGKHLVIVVGGVAEVEEAMGAGIPMAGDRLVDKLLLAQAHEQLAPLIAGGRGNAEFDSVAVVETATVCATVLAADAAAKATPVTLIDLRLAVGIGGKGFFTMSGALDDVEASVSAATQAAGEHLIQTELIARPHEDFGKRLFW